VIDVKNLKRFMEEIVLHKDLRHPNVVPFRGASWSDGRPMMVVDVSLCRLGGGGTTSTTTTTITTTTNTMPSVLPFQQYAGRGTLADVLRRSRGTLKWKTVKVNMAIGIAQGQ